jgi:hypothetical protein
VDSVFLKLNNGAWFPLPANTVLFTIVPDNPSANGTVSSKVYKGAAATLLDGTLQGLNLNGDNQLYLRARDQAGSESVIDSSKIFFAKRKGSDLLVIDCHPGGISPSPEEVYAQSLALVEPNSDHIDLRVSNGINLPRLWSPTFSTLIGFYDRIFWYGDGSDLGLSILEDASGALQGYLNANGKLLISCSFPSSFDNSSVLQEYTALDSLSSSVGSARLPTGNLLSPTSNNAANYDTLQASVFVGRATPFYHKANSEVIYTGNFTTTGGWVGPDVVCAKLTNGAGRTNVVLVTVELQQLFGRPSALENFFNEVLLNEFNW